MCGIFGVNQPYSPIARTALDQLTHRGPDQSGEWHDERLYMGHRRLSILDLSEHGRQPMVDPEQSVVIAVNGEIYNYRELKLQLKDKYHFISDSDSEVVLYGYKEWGMDGLLERVEGMFACSIYDIVARQVHLVRDPAGIKPLYYYHQGDRFAWGSELKALQCYFADLPLTVDQTALYDFLTYLYIPPPKSLYHNVFKLEAAHYLSYDLTSNRLTKKRYWSLNVKTVDIDPVNAARQLRGLVMESVEAQMVSDVPLGFFLSGGIDSSAIVGCAAQQRSESINSYTIGFEEAGFDESPFAELVAERHQTQHHCEILDQNLSLELYPKMRQWFDEPHIDTSALPTYLVSRFARQDVEVVLTGDGGDELFGGYSHYFKHQAISASGRIQSPLLKTLNRSVKRGLIGRSLGRAAANIERRFFLDGLELHTRLLGGMLRDEKHSYRTRYQIPEDYDDYWFFRQHYRPELPLISRLQYLDFHTYLPEDILTKVDRTSMAVALEARVPFITRPIIEFAFSLPEAVRLPNGEPKGVLKQAFADLLPESIINRPKKGFTVPLKRWRKTFYGDFVYPQEQLLAQLYRDESQAASD